MLTPTGSVVDIWYFSATFKKEITPYEAPNLHLQLQGNKQVDLYLPFENITQLTIQQLFRAMITHIKISVGMLPASSSSEVLVFQLFSMLPSLSAHSFCSISVHSSPGFATFVRSSKT